MNIKLVLTTAAILATLAMGGCKMTGSAIQGVGGVVNKTGGAVKNIGR